MNLNGKIGKKTGRDKRGTKQKSVGGMAHPGPPLKSPLLGGRHFSTVGSGVTEGGQGCWQAKCKK